MDTPVQSTLPADTRSKYLEAIEQGASDARSIRESLEASAPVTAAKTIADIQSLVREATATGLRKKQGRFHATLLPIGIDDTSEYLSTSTSDVLSATIVSGKSLVGAARIVYDHCVQAGLNAFVARNKSDGEKFVTYSLDIAWSSNEVEAINKADKKNKRWWQLF